MEHWAEYRGGAPRPSKLAESLGCWREVAALAGTRMQTFLKENAEVFGRQHVLIERRLAAIVYSALTLIVALLGDFISDGARDSHRRARPRTAAP